MLNTAANGQTHNNPTSDMLDRTKFRFFEKYFRLSLFPPSHFVRRTSEIILNKELQLETLKRLFASELWTNRFSRFVAPI